MDMFARNTIRLPLTVSLSSFITYFASVVDAKPGRAMGRGKERGKRELSCKTLNLLYI